MLLSSKNLLKSISREIKAKFFKNMNDIVVDKHSELKYLILMKENFRKYKIKTNYFQRWKRLSITNNNFIKENDDIISSYRMNYSLFKSMNSLSIYPKLNSININHRKSSFYKYSNKNDIMNDSDWNINNFNNTWKNDLKGSNNNIHLFEKSYNKIEENIFQKSNFNIEIIKNENSIINKNDIPKLKISNFEIKFLKNKVYSDSSNLSNKKEKNFNNLLRITKNKEFKIINKPFEKLEKIENGLNYEDKLKFNSANDSSKTKENVNKKLLIDKNNFFFNYNNNSKTDKHIIEKNNKNINKNDKKDDTDFITYLLIFVILFLGGAMIINQLNIDN